MPPIAPTMTAAELLRLTPASSSRQTAIGMIIAATIEGTMLSIEPRIGATARASSICTNIAANIPTVSVKTMCHPR